MKYTVTASRWERGWELRIEGVGATQSRGLADAETMVRSYLRMDLGEEAAAAAEIEVVPVLEPGLAEEIGALRDEIAELWGHINCPTLLVYGHESWATNPAADGRLAYFRNARVLGVPDAGHWVHHDQLDLFLDAVRSFLKPAPDQG